eukprot:7268860-Prymnesium_polylepis.1
MSSGAAKSASGCRRPTGAIPREGRSGRGMGAINPARTSPQATTSTTLACYHRYCTCAHLDPQPERAALGMERGVGVGHHAEARVAEEAA